MVIRSTVPLAIQCYHLASAISDPFILLNSKDHDSSAASHATSLYKAVTKKLLIDNGGSFTCSFVEFRKGASFIIYASLKLLDGESSSFAAKPSNISVSWALWNLFPITSQGNSGSSTSFTVGYCCIQTLKSHPSRLGGLGPGVRQSIESWVTDECPRINKLSSI